MHLVDSFEELNHQCFDLAVRKFELPVFKDCLELVVDIVHNDEDLLESAAEHDFFDINNIFMLQLNQRAQLSQCRDWKAFSLVLGVQLYALNCIDFTCQLVTCTVDNAVCPFVNYVEMFEIFD